MKWGILGALDAEVALIRNKMTITSETPMFGTVFYEGIVGREQIVLVCCGVGKVNAAVCAAAVMNQFEADCIINIGIAGAMGHGLKILDVVISSEVGFHDQDEVMLKYYPKRAFFPADSFLASLCESACRALPEWKVASVTVALFPAMFLSTMLLSSSPSMNAMLRLVSKWKALPSVMQHICIASHIWSFVPCRMLPMMLPIPRMTTLLTKPLTLPLPSS